MEPEEALHWHILRRKKDGVEDWIDASVEKIGAVPTLNKVLLPAMKEVGDKFGAGELILPFVLQSAEVMKRAVAQLENYLDRIEGHTKGKVVIATVFGDVHDIGKSLVNTILTNNGYTVVDLGKQVPVETIIDAAVEHEADAIGLSALLVSTSKQMPACIQELHQRGLEFPVLIGGAAINRDFGRRVLYPLRQGVRRGLRARGLLLQGRLRRPRHDRRAGRRGGARVAGREDPRRGRRAAQPPGRRGPGPADHRRLGALGGGDRQPRSPSRRSGACARSRSTSTRSIPTSTATCCSSCTGAGAARRARSGAGSSRATTATRASRRSWSGCGASRTTCARGSGSATSPATPTATSWSIFDPADHEREIERLVFPRQPRHDRICLADFYRPLSDPAAPDAKRRMRRAVRDVVALQAVTVGPEVTERIAQLERDGEFAEQLFVHGLGVQAAEGLAEWLHAEVRRELGIELDQGRRYSWGYPACPDQSEHEKVERLLGLSEIGIGLSGGYALEPEQSTAAIIAHHPQAVYFGMKSGFIPAESEGRRADRRHRTRRRAAARRRPGRRRNGRIGVRGRGRAVDGPGGRLSESRAIGQAARSGRSRDVDRGRVTVVEDRGRLDAHADALGERGGKRCDRGGRSPPAA